MLRIIQVPFKQWYSMKNITSENYDKDQGNRTQGMSDSRTKPFLFSGKALDFISAMLSIIVFISILGESLYTFSDKGAVVWSVLAALSLCVVVLLGLVMFYLYYGFKGLPVARELDKSIKFPPARLKPVDVIIILSLLFLDAAVFGYVFYQYLNNTVYTYSLVQFCFAFVAFSIGIIALITLVREHFIWKAKI